MKIVVDMSTKLYNKRLLRAYKKVHFDEDMMDGQMSHLRSSNGGWCSFALYEWMLISVLKFNSDKFCQYTVIELGCGPGIFSIVASALSRRARSVISIDNEPSRIDRLMSWISTIRSSMESNPQPRRYPTVRLGDFTSDEIPCYNHALKSRKVMIYLNNYCGALTGGDVQRKLEIKLASCLDGSVVLALDRLFYHDPNWKEEILSIFVRRKDIAMLNRVNGNPNEQKTMYLYKYTKVGVPVKLAQFSASGRRKRAKQSCHMFFH